MPEQLPPGQLGRGWIEGPAGALEVLVEGPRDTPPRGLLVIAHPHPLYGGTMDNKVVYMVSRGGLDAGLLTLRFNFRGVGHSGGSHDQGRGEAEDLATVVAYVRAAWPGLPLALAGFSFGSYLALSGCAALDAVGVLTVAPPLFYGGEAPVPQPVAPWWLIHGDADEVVDYADTLKRAQAATQPPAVLETAPGVGHFFHGDLPLVRDFTRRFAEQVFD